MSFLDKAVPYSCIVYAWGFIVEFVCWVSFARLIGPIAGWLLEHKERKVSPVAGWMTYIMTAWFGIGVICCLLAFPMLLGVAWALIVDGDASCCSHALRRQYGQAYMGSFIGWAVFGLLYRFRVKTKNRNTRK